MLVSQNPKDPENWKSIQVEFMGYSTSKLKENQVLYVYKNDENRGAVVNCNYSNTL